MTTLMRPALRAITRNTRDAHAGLLQQRGLPLWESGNKSEKNKLIERITHTTVPNHYHLALARWIGLTRNNNRFTSTVLRCKNRLYIGLATGNTLETGVHTHHSYGVPYLPGSSIKGAVRYYAEQNGLAPAYLDELFGGDSETGEPSGALVWHDAWWLPLNERDHPYISEIITVHHQEYYNGKTPQADGSESPIPNQQIATGGAYYFVIEGAPDWTRYALGLLNATLEHQGLGSKTASGYGYFRRDDNAACDKRINDIHNLWIKNQKAANETVRVAALPAHERLAHAILSRLGEHAKTYSDRNQEKNLQLHRIILEELQQATNNLDPAARTQLADTLAFPTLNAACKGFYSGKKEKEIKAALRQLRGEA